MRQARAGGQRAPQGERDPALDIGFLCGGARPPLSLILDDVEQHKTRFGFLPICAALTEADVKISPSTAYAAKGREPSARAVRDADLKSQIVKIHQDNYGVYAGQEGPRAAQP